MKSNRRNFIKQSTVIAAGIGATPALLNACQASSNELITVGLIGCRSMGFNDLKSFIAKDNVECLALCDVDATILDSRAAELEKSTGKKPLIYDDFRELLANKDIKVVIIGSPDHWHALMMMMALEAGKHVYVEKPMGHSIEECQAMVKAAAKYPDLKVQVGMWQRSSQHWFDASEVVHSGELGKVNLVKAWVYKGYDDPILAAPNAEAPDNVDYDMWLGPAPQRPFNKNRFHYNFRWFWDYAGGAMTDWGVHLLDFALHGMDAGYPESISPGGGLYFHEKDAIETPDIQQAIYNYPTHTMIWECGLNPGIGPYGKAHGVAFIGTKGTLVVTRDGWQTLPDTNNAERKPWFKGVKKENVGNGLDLHVQNFLDCIREGGTPNAPVEVGAKTAIISEMGNIAYRTNQILHWDSANMRFEEEDANKLAKVSYRNSWKLPVV